MEFWLSFVMLTVYTIFIPMENARAKIIFDESDGGIVWSPWNHNGCHHKTEVSNRTMFTRSTTGTDCFWSLEKNSNFALIFPVMVARDKLSRTTWLQKKHDRASGSCPGPLNDRCRLAIVAAWTLSSAVINWMENVSWFHGRPAEKHVQSREDKH